MDGERDDPDGTRQALCDRVTALASQIHAAEAELAGLIGELADTGAWCGHGYVSLGHWLGVNAGFTPAEASRRVRVADRAAGLPALAAAAAGGHVSVGLLDRACTVATPATDGQLADICVTATPAQAMRVMATQRDIEAADPDPEPEVDAERTWLRSWWDDSSRLHIDACLNAVDGAVFDTALAAAKAAGERDADDAARVSGPEALRRMSELTLDDAHQQNLTRDGTNFAVELAFDVDAATVRYGEVQFGMHDTKEVCCDTRIHHLIHQAGIALAMGRDTRTATRAQRRALRRHDGGCAFPGCGQTRFVHAHHILYWEAGGRTDLDNLVLLCTRHHRLLHAGDYHCEIGDDHQPHFTDPNGKEIVRGSPTVSPRLAWNQRQHQHTVDPTAARARSGGEPLTDYALDVLLHGLLTAA